MALLTTKQVVIRIAIIIAVSEFLIMLLLQTHHLEAGFYSEAALDTLLLAILSTPAIYIWVIKPFVDAWNSALDKINQLALTDPLTQLANRRLISEHLSKIIASGVRHKDYGAVILIDLDGFKLVNDSYRHDAGDFILVAIADRLRSVVRTEDVVGRLVGRLGGDEFVVLINRLGTDEIIARSRSLIGKPVDSSGTTLHVGASIGIRLLGFDKQDTETVISEADVAMYRAKTEGRGRAVFF
jgi:diguanylate cyclase (GGDEF)-like protein